MKYPHYSFVGKLKQCICVNFIKYIAKNTNISTLILWQIIEIPAVIVYNYTIINFND